MVSESNIKHSVLTVVSSDISPVIKKPSQTPDAFGPEYNLISKSLKMKEDSQRLESQVQPSRQKLEDEKATSNDHAFKII